MNEIALVKKRIEAQKWMQIITNCRKSDMTVAEWCDANGVGVKNYYYHLRKLRSEMCEQVAVPVSTIEPTEKEKAKATIRCENISIEVSEDSSTEFLMSLVKALKC